MIKSMTGFGRSTYQNEGREYIIEIKSVNHKYCDISIKIPKSISYLEEKIKKEIIKFVSRGKIDIYVSFNNNSTIGKNIQINKELAKIYIEQLKELAEETGVNKEISLTEIAKLPDVFIVENNIDEEIIWDELSIPLSEAIDSFISMRQIEGNKMAEDLIKRNEQIKEKIKNISELSTGLIDEYVVKLEGRIKEILKTDVVDKNRLATEIVIYADKCSIEEEITRLKSHTEQLDKMLKGNAGGKKLDFLIQEMNREINTIGSKANNIDITNLVVEIKTELENIREQVQNIE